VTSSVAVFEVATWVVNVDKIVSENHKNMDIKEILCRNLYLTDGLGMEFTAC